MLLVQVDSNGMQHTPAHTRKHTTCLGLVCKRLCDSSFSSIPIRIRLMSLNIFVHSKQVIYANFGAINLPEMFCGRAAAHTAFPANFKPFRQFPLLQFTNQMI